jgi:hypothetical protein
MTAYELVFVKTAAAPVTAEGQPAAAPKVKKRKKTGRKTPKMEIVIDKERTKASMPRIGRRNPQVGSTAYDDPDQAYEYFLARGVPADQARAAADTIGAYNVQMRRGADHATAMDILNHRNVVGSNGLNAEYHAQIVDHLNRRYHNKRLKAEDRNYGIPNNADPRARRKALRREARVRAAMDNTKYLNPPRYDGSDALRSAYTYVSHGDQVVDPTTGRLNRKATAARRNAVASSLNRAYAKKYRAQGYRINRRGQLVYE